VKNIRLAILIVIFTLGFSSTVFATEFTDIDGHWAQDEIVKWSNNGLINGYEGKFNPNNTITRGEMAVIIDRLFDYQLSAENSFSDLPDDWYTDAILKNNEKGIILGYEGQARPLDKVTRQEAIVMLGKAFDVRLVDRPSTFTDAVTIGSWAMPYANAMQDAGYISGKPDGGFYPTEDITRAEIVAIVDRIVGAYYNKSGEYTGDVSGLVLVNTKDVVLKDMNISGDLIIAEGVADGDITLKSVDVKGHMYVYGGGQNSIKLYNTSVGTVILGKKASKVRLYSDGKIEEIVVAKDAAVIIDGDLSIDDIVIKDNSVIEIRKNVKVSVVNLNAKDVKATFNGDIGTLNMDKNRGTTQVEGSGKIDKVTERENRDDKGDGSTSSSSKVDSVSSASKSSGSSSSGGSSGGGSSSKDRDKDKNKGSSGNNSSNNNSSNNNNNNNTGNTNNAYTIKPSFIAAPTVDVVVTYNKATQKGYTLYVDGKVAGTDSDNDGVVTTVSNYFTNAKKVEFSPKGSSTKYTLDKK